MTAIRPAVATADAGYFQKLLAYAAHQGLATGRLLAGLDVDEAQLFTPGARLSSLTLYALWDRLAAELDDPAVGVHFAEAVELDTGAMALVRYASGHSATLGEAADRAARYMRLVDNANRVYARVGADGAVVGFEGKVPGGGLNRYAAQFGLGAVLVAGRVMTGQAFPCREVRFVHLRGTDYEEAETRRLFGCERILYGSLLDELVVAPELFAMPLLQADPALAAVLDGYAGKLLTELADDDGVVARVRRLVVDTLPEGAPLALLAKKLGMSARTLQRRLHEAGTSHQDIVDDVRRALAPRYLENDAMGQTEVAFLLGYSESTAFARAFKRWYGKAPGAWVKAKR